MTRVRNSHEEAIDLRSIWAQQGIDQQPTNLITAACPTVNLLFTDPGGVNLMPGRRSRSLREGRSSV